VKDLLYVFDPSKQITSRFFVAALLRMTLRQVRRATGGKPTTAIFERGHEEHEVKKFKRTNYKTFVSFVRFVVKSISDLGVNENERLLWRKNLI
jgi:hypothetical protein